MCIRLYMFMHVYMYMSVSIITCMYVRKCIRMYVSMYLAQGLPPPQLHLVTRMTTASSLMYTSPSWWGFTDASDRSRLDRQLASLIDGPGFFHLTFLHSASLHGMLTL